MIFPVIILGLLSFTPGLSGQTTNVQACFRQSDASTLPINTYIIGCTDPPCSATQLENIQMNLVFKAPRQIRNLRTEAHAYVPPVPVGLNYSLGADAITCNSFTNTYCPLLKDEVVEYELRMFIESWMLPDTSATIEFVIRDVADNSAVACFRTGIFITRPLNSKQSKDSKHNNIIDTYPEPSNITTN